jgi:putative transposase
VYSFGEFLNRNNNPGANREKGTPPVKQQTTREETPSINPYEALESWARANVQDFIQGLLEQEVNEFIGRLKSERHVGLGRRVYRNGHGNIRNFGMMGSTIEIRRPRIRNSEERFESRIIPLFRRKSKELEAMLPELYLHGLAKGDFALALGGLLGDGAPLSRSSIERLKASWQLEREEWKSRDLSELEIVYIWADGLYVKAGLEDQKGGAPRDYRCNNRWQKVLLACESGQRESKEAWLLIIRDLIARGLRLPKLTTADGHLGIWAALGEIHPNGAEQRCWNHKICNVLDKRPKKEQPAAKQLLRSMSYAESRAECEKQRDQFISRYRKSYPKATETLLSDWDRMVTLYSFPKEHWVHLRTTNIVESPFDMIRLRTNAARRFKRVDNATSIIWKLLMIGEKAWRSLKGAELLRDVFDGKRFIDGMASRKAEKEKERICA